MDSASTPFSSSAAISLVVILPLFFAFSMSSLRISSVVFTSAGSSAGFSSVFARRVLFFFGASLISLAASSSSAALSSSCSVMVSVFLSIALPLISFSFFKSVCKLSEISARLLELVAVFDPFYVIGKRLVAVAQRLGLLQHRG